MATTPNLSFPPDLAADTQAVLAHLGSGQPFDQVLLRRIHERADLDYGSAARLRLQAIIEPLAKIPAETLTAKQSDELALAKQMRDDFASTNRVTLGPSGTGSASAQVLGVQCP